MAIPQVASSPPRSKRILVCDDERHIVRLVQTWLEQKGHSVATCFDGVDALEMLRKEPFDLLILDVMMPRKDGLEVLKEIRTDQALAEQRVILLTAKSQDADVYAGYHYGADLYLTKPLQSSDLMPFVERL